MSGITGLVFLVNKSTKTILFAGDLPESYNGISGLVGVERSILQDLHTHFREIKLEEPQYQDNRFLNLGFFSEADALALPIDPTLVAQKKAAAWEIKWNSLDQERNDLIQAQQWRVDRYNNQVALDIPPTEPDIRPVLVYMQAIRDLPVTNPDPYNIVWPPVPPLPGN